jgi:hypothetical protein
MEALRKEIELLRLNLLVVMEKVRAQEAELNAFRGQRGGPPVSTVGMSMMSGFTAPKTTASMHPGYGGATTPFSNQGAKMDDPAQRAEAALKALRETKDEMSRRRLLVVLEGALRSLREQRRQSGSTTPRANSVP